MCGPCICVELDIKWEELTVLTHRHSLVRWPIKREGRKEDSSKREVGGEANVQAIQTRPHGCSVGLLSIPTPSVFQEEDGGKNEGIEEGADT